MFNVGDMVLYGSTGVCRISEVTDMRMGRETKKYFILNPVSQDNSTVFVPVDNELLVGRMRKVLTESEIKKMLNDVDQNENIWIDNDAERGEKFNEIIKSGDRGQIILVVRALYKHQRELTKHGKKLHLADERCLKDAERLIRDEFSIVLNIEPDMVGDYISGHLN